MGRIRDIFLRSFGLENEPGLQQQKGFLFSAMALAFVVSGFALLFLINMATLLFGVFVNFLGRNGIRFQFLTLWGPIKAIYIYLPILLIYAIWHRMMVSDLLTILAAPLLTTAAALLIILLGAALNRRQS